MDLGDKTGNAEDLIKISKNSHLLEDDGVAVDEEIGRGRAELLRILKL